MLVAALPALDLSGLLQFVFSVLLILAGAIIVVKRTAFRYFVVDAGFEGDPGYEVQRRGKMSIGGDGSRGHGGQEEGNTCATCGNPGNKKCSRCKRVRYCSPSCQSKHWETDHRYKCKQLKLSEKEEVVSLENGSCSRRKPFGFNPISLVPAHGTCNVLQEPKKMLFPYDEFVKLFNWENPGFPPCGLVNCGNSCFANVVLQCLACTRPLTAYLLERDHSRDCIRKRDDWCFLCELQVHIQRASKSPLPFSPVNILSRLPKIGGNLGYGRQEDAHEFMRFAIDTMQSVCLDEFGGEKVVDSRTQETTVIQYIFGGQLQSQVTCTKCNMISNRYENMMDLTVEIQGDVESLDECLKQFTAREWLDGENKYKCDGCNDYVRAWKRLTVHQAPNILTIALKRFQSGRFGKLNKRVTFTENLDLSPFMSGNGDGTDQYTLYAVVVHVDMLNASFFGHYICYTKDSYGQWYRIDDCKVMNVDVEDVLSEGAYMLLYRRRTARREPFVKPVEPHRVRQFSEAVAKVSATSKVSNGFSLSSLPPDIGTQEYVNDLLSLGDAENEIKLSADVDSVKSSKMVLNAPVVGNSIPLCEDLADMDVDDSSTPEHRSTSVNTKLDSPEASIQEVHDEKSQEQCGFCDAGTHQEASGSNNSTEVSIVKSHTTDQSLSYQKNEAILEPSSVAPTMKSMSTIKSMVYETSNDAVTLGDQWEETCSGSDSAVKFDRLDGTCPGNDCDEMSSSIWDNGLSPKSKPEHCYHDNTFLESETNKTLLSFGENGFSMQKNSGGFSLRPARMKYVGVKKTHNNSHLVDHVLGESGKFNGHAELGLEEQGLLSSLTKGRARSI